MANYSELLRDPRWQRKRLEIFQLDAFQCRRCNSKEKTLNVHHLYYVKGNDPWDYPNTAFATMCDDCHSLAHSVKWQQAFLDLNATEFDLLEIALLLQFRKKKMEEKLSDLLEKHKCRIMYFYMVYNLFADGEEIEEFYKVQQELQMKYHGQAIH